MKEYKIHLVNINFGTLTGDDGKPLGRMWCAGNDYYQRNDLRSVRFNKKGVTCKRCLKRKRLKK